jgi:hypothetical protein
MWPRAEGTMIAESSKRANATPTISRARIQWLIVALVLLLPPTLRAQTTITAFLPEVDSYFRLSSNVRLLFDAKGYMENGDLNHAQIGPSLQFNTRPLESLKRITIFDMDDMKCMPVVFTIGYRYLPSTTQPSVNRLQPIVLFNLPFPGSTLVTDRNRGISIGRTAVSTGPTVTASLPSAAGQFTLIIPPPTLPPNSPIKANTTNGASHAFSPVAFSP